MLTKQHRLKTNKDFELVFKKGRALDAKFLFLKMTKRNHSSVPRFGFIIGTKISKKATIRNKIKRRLREVIRKNLENIKPGFDVIIGAKAGIVDRGYQEIEKEVEGLLEKAGII